MHAIFSLKIAQWNMNNHSAAYADYSHLREEMENEKKKPHLIEF